MSGTSRLAILAGHADLPNALAFSPDGRLLASGDGQGWVYLWDLADRGPARVLRRPDLRRRPAWTASLHRCRVPMPDRVEDLAFVAGGTRLAIAMGWTGLEVWSLATGRLERRIPRLSGPITPDGMDVLAWARRARLVRIDPRTGRRVREVRMTPALDATGTFGEGPRCDAHLRRVAQLREGEIRVWDIDTGRVVASMRVATGETSSEFVTLDPGGGRAAVRIDQTVVGVDLVSGSARPLVRCGFDPNGPPLWTFGAHQDGASSAHQKGTIPDRSTKVDACGGGGWGPTTPTSRGATWRCPRGPSMGAEVERSRKRKGPLIGRQSRCLRRWGLGPHPDHAGPCRV